MSETINESLEKEFELERMILFSDAVFAIAITLLILEIKFPELPESFKGINKWKFFKPTVIHFFAFTISFFFIGMSWARHLAMCRFLKKYNNTVILFNLLLLFFIVVFPFSISAFVDNVNNSLFIAVIIYISNIFLVIFAQFLFTYYILKKNTALVIAGEDEEKQYFYMKAKYSFLMLLTVIIIIIAVFIISNGNLLAVALSIYILPVFAIILRRKLKKYKPKKINRV
ncbi:MAG: TMEM175 family protein [Parafilimonas sp.]